MCFRVSLLLLVFCRGWSGNQRGINDRSLLQYQIAAAQLLNDLFQKTFTYVVLLQYAPKPPDGIAIRHLIAGVDPTESRKSTAVDDFIHDCHICQIV